MHSAKTTNQMYESSAGEPDADERGDELTEADAVGSLEDVEILQDVRDGHQTQSASEPQTCRPVTTSAYSNGDARPHR